MVLEIRASKEAMLDVKTVVGLSANASKYKSDIWLEKADRRANVKSVMGLLALGLQAGDAVSLIIEGEDETVAMTEMQNIMEEVCKESVSSV